MTFASESGRMGRRPFAVVELDLDSCSRTYGVAPCTAAIGFTGSTKCYNTRGTCQDPANFAKIPKTYRFCMNVADVPRDLEALPFITSVRITPTKLKIGAGLGERGSVTITLTDGKHNDVGIDPYVDERTYDAESQGTFFGRLFARNGYYIGRPLRLITGYLTSGARGEPVFDAANTQTRLYFIEKVTGPDAQGRVSIVAKDILKLADDDRAKAPRPSQARLSAGITAASGSATVVPAGAGDLYFGTSGKLRINSEIISYSRVLGSDVLTLTARGQNFTTAASASADDVVQVCWEVEGMTAHEILHELFTEYAGIDTTYIPLDEWQNETDTYTNNRAYTGLVAEPTGVNKLAGEICEQAPAYVWWDEVRSKIIFRALRPASSASAQLTDDASFLADSVQIQDKPDQRISEAVVHFGQRNPTESLDKRSNYAATYVLIGDGESVNKHGQARIREVFARFIPSSGRTAAQQVADAIIQRFDEIPKQIDFRCLPKETIGTGDLFQAVSRLLQGADGAPLAKTFQVLSAEPQWPDDEHQVSALEERYSLTSGATTRVLYVSEDRFGYNLRTDHDTLYQAPSAAVDVVLYIAAGVKLGSLRNSGLPGFDTGEWPTGTTITIYLAGRIQGYGGDGGFGAGSNGQNGGDALKARLPITVNCTTGTPQIWSGGGGSPQQDFISARLSGGGAGYEPGIGEGTGSATTEAGSSVGGGGPGQDGFITAVSTGGVPGVAGKSIVGSSYVTFVGTADIRGPQIS